MFDVSEVIRAALKFASEKWAYVAGATLMVGANFLADGDGLPRYLKFYHQGWLESNKSWIILLIMLGVGSFALCLNRIGAVAVGLLCIGLAIFFGFAYNSLHYGESYWPLVVWLAYRGLLALLVGVVAAITNALQP